MASFWETLTLETSTERQREEFIKKYRGTYVWVTILGQQPRLCFFDEYSQNERLYSFKHMIWLFV